ncbi:TPA: hypothetical protein ACXDAZ_000518 [Clostridium botulinum]
MYSFSNNVFFVSGINFSAVDSISEQIRLYFLYLYQLTYIIVANVPKVL